MEKKRRKIVKGKVENWKWKERRESWKWREDHLKKKIFKTPKNCFGSSTKTEISYREKAFHAGKKLGKITLPP